MHTRVPVRRKAIILSKDIILKLKLQEIERETRNDAIIELSKHFDMLSRKQFGTTGFNSLSLTNPTRHKNWGHFEYTYELCRYKEWDAKEYIEQQFYRFNTKYRKNLYASGLNSDAAIRHYIQYLGVKKATTRGKSKPQETYSLREEILISIQKDIERLSFFSISTPEDKAIHLSDAYSSYSAYYLWSIPWFHSLLPTISGRKAKEIVKTFSLIDKSINTQNTVMSIVSELEELHSIPKNLKL